MKLTHWHDACNKVWFDESRIEAMTSEEQELFRDSFIMYEEGKGVNHLVPVLVPDDTVSALHKLSDPAFRRDCGIAEDNQYLFPSTGGSSDNVSGWHSINCICEKAGVKLNATKVRHLTSTLYAALDIPEAKRASFYRHMGHSKSINESIYQTPLAEVEVAEVGSILKKFGKMLHIVICISFTVSLCIIRLAGILHSMHYKVV